MNESLQNERWLRLNNGVMMPSLGFGVYRIAPEATTQAVLSALQAGYRLIDTAAAYNNEREVGEAVRRSGIPRSDIFVTSKLWPTDYGQDAAARALDRSLGKLGLDYVDMFLLHWPLPSRFSQTVASYRVLEQNLAAGRIRAIGVCNHDAANLEALMAETSLVPAVNQVELHPFFPQKELAQAHARLGIVTQAWSPLGGVNIYDAAPGKAQVDGLPCFVHETRLHQALQQVARCGCGEAVGQGGVGVGRRRGCLCGGRGIDGLKGGTRHVAADEVDAAVVIVVAYVCLFCFHSDVVFRY